MLPIPAQGSVPGQPDDRHHSNGQEEAGILREHPEQPQIERFPCDCQAVVSPNHQPLDENAVSRAPNANVQVWRNTPGGRFRQGFFWRHFFEKYFAPKKLKTQAFFMKTSAKFQSNSSITNST